MMNSRGMQEEWILHGIFPPPSAAEKRSISSLPVKMRHGRDPDLSGIRRTWPAGFLWIWEKGGLLPAGSEFFHWSEMLPSCTSLKKMYQGKAGAAGNRKRSAERAKEHRQAGTVLRRNDPSAGFPDRIAGKFRK